MRRRFSLKNLNLQNLVFYAIAACVVVLIIFQQPSVDNQIQQYEDACNQLAEAEQYQEELLEQRDYVTTDEYKEELAREHGYVEDNEIVFVYEYEK